MYKYKNGKLTPMIDSVYLTKKLSYALIYAFWANMVGSLLTPDEVEKVLPKAKEVSLEWEKIQTEFGHNAWELCMQFMATLPVPVVIGAGNERQARENVGFLNAESFTKTEIEQIYNRLAPYLSNQITNPRKW